MSEAPERIAPAMDEAEEMSDWGPDWLGGEGIEYIRADLARAQVAAAYVAAANKVSIHMLGRNKAFADRVVAHVRALTPDDAKAALGDMLKAERDRIAGLVMVLRAHDQETDFEKGFDDACVAVLREIRALAQEDGE